MDRKRQIIMLVDDNHANLNIGKNILKASYEVYALPSAERLFKFLETVTPDLILLDIVMPGMNGFDVIKILKADARHTGIPVIFVTSKTEETNELEGLALGAVDRYAQGRDLENGVIMGELALFQRERGCSHGNKPQFERKARRLFLLGKGQRFEYMPRRH